MPILDFDTPSISSIVATDGFPYPCAQGGAYERGDDEEPQLRERHATLEQRRAYAAGGVDGRARDGDAYDVHQHERQADSQPRKVAGAPLLVGRAQYHEDEDEREDRLGDEDLSCSYAGFGTLRAYCTQVAGFHRAVPSTALDKVIYTIYAVYFI